MAASPFVEMGPFLLFSKLSGHRGIEKLETERRREREREAETEKSQLGVRLFCWTQQIDSYTWTSWRERERDREQKVILCWNERNNMRGWDQK